MNQEITKIVVDAEGIVKHLESAKAGRQLKRVRKLLEQAAQGALQTDEISALRDLEVKLQLVAFDGLSDADAEGVMRGHILDFYKSDVSLEERLTNRYQWQGDFQMNEQRRILKAAILANVEKVGPHEIGAWIKKYDAIHDKNATEPRQKAEIMKFFEKDAEAQKLSPVQKAVLADILRIYDALLSSELITADEIDDMLEYLDEHPDEPLVQRTSPSSRIAGEQKEGEPLAPEKKVGEYLGVQSAVREASMRMQKEGGDGALTLTMAMAKYPNLGEQSVTFNPIKLRSFPQAVRPSIKNWINDYYENIGAGKHGLMERGNYLFNSPNAKKLTNLERQRLGYVLKALDEDAAVTVDAAKQEIVYPEAEKEDIPHAQAAPAQPSPNVTFSSPHQLPSEKRVPVPPRRPGFMSPVMEGNGSGARPAAEPRLDGNVVDLKN